MTIIVAEQIKSRAKTKMKNNKIEDTKKPKSLDLSKENEFRFKSNEQEIVHCHENN